MSDAPWANPPLSLDCIPLVSCYRIWRQKAHHINCDDEIDVAVRHEHGLQRHELPVQAAIAHREHCLARVRKGLRCDAMERIWKIARVQPEGRRLRVRLIDENGEIGSAFGEDFGL